MFLFKCHLQCTINLKLIKVKSKLQVSSRWEGKSYQLPQFHGPPISKKVTLAVLIYYRIPHNNSWSAAIAVIDQCNLPDQVTVINKASWKLLNTW